MRIIRNDKLIKRNSRIGAVTSLGGLAAIVVSLVLSFTRPEQVALAWGLLLIGFVMIQLGLYFGNRWGRRPRLDEMLDSGLKGLDDRYTIYHWNSPVAHLLIGPAGLWILLAYYQAGKIIYAKGRYRQQGGTVIQRYMRIFGQEGLGRPDLDVISDTSSMKRFFTKYLPEMPPPNIQAVLVMTHDKAEVEVQDSPNPIVQLKKLKELIRKNTKENGLTPEQIQAITNALPEA